MKNQTRDDLNILLYLDILIKRRWIIIGTVIPVFIITIIYLLNVSPIYLATATILPPANLEAPTGVSQLVQAYIGTAVPKNINTPVLYGEILASRTVNVNILNQEFWSNKVGAKIKLIDILVIGENDSTKRYELGYENLRGQIQVSLDQKTLITTLSVKSSESILASDIAKALIEQLNVFNRKGISRKAKENRIFIQERLVDTDSLLRSFEDELRQFREFNKRIENSPELQIELGRKLREVRIQEEIFITLKKEFEITRIEEIKSIPTINVLNEPVPPLKKHWPMRRKITYLVSLYATFMGVALAFIIEFLSKKYEFESFKMRFKKLYILLKNDLISILYFLKKEQLN
ncbi:hypothetical protein E3V55_05560 [Candidatus Marinimicrobia bacterium MT.SAG.3]|nr:hypothetical protein E3V55_05560 [Candidatus Marinimicrobia bacterium MT.SAG.3]